jgi:hypothetical protein
MKRAVASLLASLGAVLVLFALLLAFRLPLAEAGLRWWLATQGAPQARLNVVALTMSGLEIADLQAGTDGSVRIEDIAIAWTPASLARLRAESVTITAPRLRVVLDSRGLSIPGISLPSGGGDPRTAIDVPADRLVLRDGLIEAATPYGALSIGVVGVLDSDESGWLRGTLALAASGDPGRMMLDVEVAGTDSRRLDGTVTISDGVVATPEFAVAALRGDGRFVWADGALSEATLSIGATGTALPHVADGLRGRLDLEFSYREAQPLLRAVFAEDAGGRGLAIDARVSHATVEGSTRSANIAASVAADRIVAEGIDIEGLKAIVPLKVEQSANRIDVRLTEKATAAAVRLSAFNAVLSTMPLTATMRPTSAPLATIELDADGGIAAFAHTLSAAVDATSFALMHDTREPRGLDVAEVRLNYSGRLAPPESYVGRGTIATSRAALHRPEIALQRVEADVRLNGLPPDGMAQIDIGRLADGVDPPRFAEIGLAIQARREDGRTSFTAHVSDAMRTTRATASGPWPLVGRRDEIFVEVPPINFVRGGLQPGTLYTPLSVLDVEHGSVSGIARLRRNEAGFVASAEIFLDGLSFEVAGATVSGLSTHIDFDDLVSPATPSGQLLTIDRIDLATPLDDVRVVYALAADSAGLPRLDIASLRADLLGGTISTSNVALSLDSRVTELPITVERLDLTRMFALLGIDDVEGTGTLSGRIPIVLTGADAEVRGARLVAEDAGVLRINAAAASRFLAAQGESVDLALRALEDFRYSELKIDIDRAAGGEARVVLTMLGHNPAVLDGHPFRFNVNLRSNVDQLVAALLQGYRIASENLERAAGKPAR